MSSMHLDKYSKALYRSSTVGISDKQKAATKNKEAFKLKAWLDEQGCAFFNKHIAVHMRAWWAFLQKQYPTIAKDMEDKVPRKYWLSRTPFTKVTVAMNNPTPVHFDDKNYGLTFLVSFEVGDEGSLVGGSHCIFCMQGGAALVVQDSGRGTTIVGDYRRLLHANLATSRGRRLVVTCYTSKYIVDLSCSGREGAHACSTPFWN